MVILANSDCLSCTVPLSPNPLKQCLVFCFVETGIISGIVPTIIQMSTVHMLTRTRHPGTTGSWAAVKTSAFGCVSAYNKHICNQPNPLSHTIYIYNMYIYSWLLFVVVVDALF